MDVAECAARCSPQEKVRSFVLLATHEEPRRADEPLVGVEYWGRTAYVGRCFGLCRGMSLYRAEEIRMMRD